MYRKPDDDPLYIDKRLNYSPSVTKELPASIYNRRSSSLSSSKLAFDSVANVYEAALHKSNYNGKVEYSPDNPATTTAHKRETTKKHHLVQSSFWHKCTFKHCPGLYTTNW
jgi:hypothetical protein